MRRILGLTRLTARGALRPLPSAPWRFCATVPSEEEVVRAYGVLGVTTTSPYADVKKRYLNLAKEHHPDVSTSSASGSSRMVDINHAYSVVTQFHKAGRTLSAARRSGSTGSTGSTKGGASSWANAEQNRQQQQQQRSAYHPWHEDVDPLLYEMMWEEMRRQNEEEAFAQSSHPGEFAEAEWSHAYPFYAQYQQQYGAPQSRRPKPRGTANTRNDKSTAKPVKTTTWPETDLKALVNMYQDGKSFDFIANALGKEAPAVVEEFNRWSEDSKKNRRHQSKRNHSKHARRRPAVFYDGPFYYTESPDDDIPFEFYDMMGGPGGMDGDDDSGDPYGYYDDGDGFDDTAGAPNGGAMPFTGTHYMHGTPQHTHKAHSGGDPHGRPKHETNQKHRHRKRHNSNNNQGRPYNANSKSGRRHTNN